MTSVNPSRIVGAAELFVLACRYEAPAENLKIVRDE
jgi:hypothetical protein